jgi:hypothetical protein
MKPSVKNNIANPALYRLYYGYMLPDIAHKIGLDATPYVKQRLHEIHKKYLKYESIAGASQKRVSLFLFEVCALWACFGIFVRTREDQPLGIENMELKNIWHLL